jgi:hypothetical protein
MVGDGSHFMHHCISEVLTVQPSDQQTDIRRTSKALLTRHPCTGTSPVGTSSQLSLILRIAVATFCMA